MIIAVFPVVFIQELHNPLHFRPHLIPALLTDHKPNILTFQIIDRQKHRTHQLLDIKGDVLELAFSEKIGH